MEGYTTEEIADQLDCARRTVARRLDLIRKIWSEAGRENRPVT
jgi:DNA-directed RNA polymerase specialized sigma24 family protein